MNENNLIPNASRTPNELREIASRGGKASGEARRKKKNMKQKMKALLELAPTLNGRKQLEVLGVDPDDMDNEMVLVMAMFMGAADGDTKAFDRVMQILGKDIRHEELALKKRELKLREAAVQKDSSASREEVHIIDDV